MKKLLILFVLVISSSYSYADVSNPTEWTEADASPSVFDPYKISVSNGTLTDNADGTISITTGGGGASAAGGVGKVQFVSTDGTSLSGDGGLVWFPSSNTLVLSRDASQTGYAIIISSDTSTLLANISHDGTAYFDGLQLSTSLPILEGGTGQSTQTAAFDALSPTTTVGDIIVYDGTDNVRLPKGVDGQILSTDSATATDLSWVNFTGYTEVLEEGTVLTQRRKVNFTGAGVSCADGAANSRTDCTISGGGGGVTAAGTSGFVTFISSDNTNVSSDETMVWYRGSNTLNISRDVGQVGEAIRISSDTGAILANISHDGSAFFNSLQLGTGTVFINFPVASAYISADLVSNDSARLDGGLTNWKILFADSNPPFANAVTWFGIMPEQYSGGSLTAQIKFQMLSSDNSKISFDVSIMAVTSGDNVDFNTESYDTANAKNQGIPDVAVSRDQTMIIPLPNADGIAANDWFKVRLRRIGADAITGDSSVNGFAIYD